MRRKDRFILFLLHSKNCADPCSSSSTDFQMLPHFWLLLSILTLFSLASKEVPNYKEETLRQKIAGALRYFLEATPTVITMDYYSRDVPYSEGNILGPKVTFFVLNSLERNRIGNLNTILRLCAAKRAFIELVKLIYASSSDDLMIQFSVELLGLDTFIRFIEVIYELNMELFGKIYQKQPSSYEFSKEKVRLGVHTFPSFSEIDSRNSIVMSDKEAMTSYFERILQGTEGLPKISDVLTFIKQKEASIRSMLNRCFFISAALSPVFTQTHINICRYFILNRLISDFAFAEVVNLLASRNLVDRVTWMSKNCTQEQASRVKEESKAHNYPQIYSKMFESVTRNIADLFREDENRHKGLFYSFTVEYLEKNTSSIVHGYYYDMGQVDGVCYNEEDEEFVAPIIKIKEPDCVWEME